MTPPRLLFILKRREDYDSDSYSYNSKGLSTGLFNSANFIVDMLISAGVDARLEIVVDNNSIDKVVTQHQPTHVILEALWVVPTKLPILRKLHPNVKWIIRLHSETPFLASEGMAFGWIGDYIIQDNVFISSNAPRMMNEIKTYITTKEQWTQEKVNKKIFYLPNYYPQNYTKKEYQANKEHIDIGCFGAIRPLKNHMLQAIASVKFAEHIGKKLRFHINTGRIEMKGEPIMSNLKGFFQHLQSRGHELIIDIWAPHEEFLILCNKMDIGLQVSFSETFNIVAADLISQGIPVVGSTEIPWIDKTYSAYPTMSDEIYRALLLTHVWPQDNVESNQRRLTGYTTRTEEIWLKYVQSDITTAESLYW